MLRYQTQGPTATGAAVGVDGRTEKGNPASFLHETGFEDRPGGVLLSHSLTRAVPLALEGLTSEFGMGSGMAPPTLPPEDSEVCHSTSRTRAH